MLDPVACRTNLELTMNTYTDPRLLDVAGALDVLPVLPLDESPEGERGKARGGRRRAPTRERLYRCLYQLPATRGRKGPLLTRQSEITTRVIPLEVSLVSKVVTASQVMAKSGRRDSNPQHSAWKAAGIVWKCCMNKDLQAALRTLVPLLVPMTRIRRNQKVQRKRYIERIKPQPLHLIFNV